MESLSGCHIRMTRQVIVGVVEEKGTVHQEWGQVLLLKEGEKGSELCPESVFAKVILVMIKCSLGCLRGTRVRLPD